MITPTWVSTRTQPIAVDDVVRYLIPFDPMPYDDAVRQALAERREANGGSR
jgi:hypothetical protein